jgi:hypothetical protein
MNDFDASRGFALFNSGHFFDAHEALEDLWREAPSDRPIRRHLQGLVQLAVAFHHQSTGNRIGARSVLRRALRNIEGAELSFPEIDWDGLRGNLDLWREYLAANCEKDAHSAHPPLPKILVLD